MIFMPGAYLRRGEVNLRAGGQLRDAGGAREC